MAVMIGRSISWKKVGTDDARQKVMSRVAYATRYGGAGFGEAMSLDQEVLQDFIEAVSEIVREENKSSR